MGTFSLKPYRTALALLALGLALGVSGCLTNVDSSRSPSSYREDEAGDLPTNGTTEVLSLVGVVPSNQSPGTLLDLIGANGDIALKCGEKLAGTDGVEEGETSCTCRFKYTDSSGNEIDVPSDPIYAEANLLRCPYSVVDADVATFKVWVHVNAEGGDSNKWDFTRGTISSQYDTSNALNYLAVKRFTCKHVLGAPTGGGTDVGGDSGASTVDTGLYDGLFDPRLWNFNMVVNFYTTFLGLDYGASPLTTVKLPAPATTDPGTSPSPAPSPTGDLEEGASSNANVAGWECPVVMNDPSEKDAFGNKLYDEPIYSETAIDLTSASATARHTIYPATDDKGGPNCLTGKEEACEKYKANRHDFYLASFRSGVFNQGFCALHRVSNLAPGQKLKCTIDDPSKPVTLGTEGVGDDIIGFAALPDSRESCPSDKIKIPDNKKWAKVWQFRASIAPRTISYVTNKNQIGELACTTPKKECKATGGTNSVCWDTEIAGVVGIGPQMSTTIGDTNDGTDGFGNCNTKGTIGANTDAPGAYNPAGACHPGTGDPGENCCYDDGTDADNRAANFSVTGGYICNPALKGGNATVMYGDPADPDGFAEDVWLMGNGTRKACIEADTDLKGLLADAPYIYNPLTDKTTRTNPYAVDTLKIDAESGWDYIYVVTPAEVKLNDMKPGTETFRKYRPFKQFPNQATATPPPAGQVSGLMAYELVLGGTSTGTEIDRYSKFPLCVLQDKKPGDSE